MKKYLFLAVLLCGTSIASMGAERDLSEQKLAHKKVETEINFDKIKENVILFFDFTCVNVTYSCGATGVVCGNSASEITRTALAFDAIACD